MLSKRIVGRYQPFLKDPDNKHHTPESKINIAVPRTVEIKDLVWDAYKVTVQMDKKGFDELSRESYYISNLP